MNRFYGMPLKTLAAILSFLLFVAAVLGALCVYVMFEMGVYTQSATEIYSNLGGYIIGIDAQTIFLDLKNGYENPNYYRYGVRFEVKDSDGHVLYSDLYGHDYDLSYTADFEAYHWGGYEEFSESAIENNEGLREYLETHKDAEYYAPVKYDDGYYREGYYVLRDGYPLKDCNVTAYLLTGENWGIYNVLCRGIPIAFTLRFWIFPILAVSILGFVLLVVFLMCSAGRKKGRDDVLKGPLDKIPFDLYTAFTAAVAVFLSWLIFEAMDVGDIFTVLVILIAGSVGYFLLLCYFMSVAVRLKCGDVLKNTLIYIVLEFVFAQLAKLFRYLGYILRRLPFVWKSVLITLAIALYNLIAALTYDPGYGFVMWLIEAVVLIPLAVMFVISLRKIQKGGIEISRGNIDFQIDTKYMTGSLRDFSEDLNSIGEGFSKAVDERMKSERFKTELITNVSHDIKTPLTSIINYVDLIKKENIESDTMRQYVDVLDRQSTRLKKLIEDLVEASKASTGNVAVELERCDVGVILAQAAAEYESKLKKNRLELIISQCEEECYIMADGRHLWRVMDNLMNNICKYAQPDTRVYINIEKKNGTVSIVFRNISRFALNLSSEEFLERFTRGDSSRSTEGSGLGLSIANSLTELQGGTLSLTVDGDLFKVSLNFAAV